MEPSSLRTLKNGGKPETTTVIDPGGRSCRTEGSVFIR